ncbi:MAG: hypothetical protein E7538_09115 [Ruminococcaceae bacterium]|nr:hypothetical protein [Oscillospiraceae bacterium]
MKLTVKEAAVFSMLGAVMYCSKMLMEALPNIHLIGVLTMALTLVYRKKALYPIYVFVFITGLLSGFSTWWVPYLYIWTVLWGVTMLLPKKLPKKAAPLIYMTVCGLHGIFYGILYAPVQAVFFGLDFKGMLSWIAAGFSFDLIHCASNFLCATLVIPVAALIRKAEKYSSR